MISGRKIAYHKTYLHFYTNSEIYSQTVPLIRINKIKTKIMFLCCNLKLDLGIRISSASGSTQCYRTASVCSDWPENSGLDELKFGEKRKIKQ